MIDHQSDYSAIYRDLFSEALAQSKKLGFTRAPLVSEKSAVANELLKYASEYMSALSEFLSFVVGDYWGNSCQTLSTNIFAHLNLQGVPADIVVGNVIINGTDEFEATLETVSKEFLSRDPLEGHQSIHAWVSLGDDTIVDAAMMPRLVKNYGAPPHWEDRILIGRASEFLARYQLRYQPLLVGTEFFAKTNPPDPMELLAELKRTRGF